MSKPENDAEHSNNCGKSGTKADALKIDKCTSTYTGN
jgi:hypothetical protein